MKRILFFLYQLIVWLPLFVASTVVTALTVIVGCSLGKEAVFSYYPGRWWSRFVCGVSLCPVRVHGREKLEAHRSYVFVSNHQGIYDIFLLYGYLDVPIKWVMKKSLRDIPLVGKACEKAGFVFVDNSSPSAALQTIREAEQRLKNGASIAIFPEGSRTRTGALGKFKKGACQMAIDLHLPVVPVTINGSYRVMSRNTILLTPGRMEVIIHDPISTDASPVAAGNLREAALRIRRLSDLSREVIASALG
jgi:1-acyl-sn-glycerol-3-phosphate acyltransferase